MLFGMDIVSLHIATLLKIRTQSSHTVLKVDKVNIYTENSEID